MPHQFVEHTADIRMRVEGATLEEVFRSAMAGLMELLEPLGASGPSLRRPMELTAGDATALLVDFLGMVLLWALTRRERYHGIEFISLTEHTLQAELVAESVTGFGSDVKAVTYHEAELRRTPAGMWETTIVFDI